MTAGTQAAGIHGPARVETRKAWWSLVLYPVAYVAGFVAGQAIPLWLGYDVAVTEAPWWAAALAFGGALVVVASPLLVTARYSRHAAARGEQGARAPLLLGALIVGAFALVNLFSALVMMILE